jgi:hypothetical protein
MPYPRCTEFTFTTHRLGSNLLIAFGSSDPGRVLVEYPTRITFLYRSLISDSAQIPSKRCFK